MLWKTYVLGSKNQPDVARRVLSSSRKRSKRVRA